MRIVVALVTTFALSVLPALPAAAGDPPSDLVRLGKKLNLEAAQASAWQAVLDTAASSKSIARAEQQALMDVMQTELDKVDADMPLLTTQQAAASQRAMEAQNAEQLALLAFYSAANPEQQARIREHLLDKVRSMRRLVSIARTLGLDD